MSSNPEPALTGRRRKICGPAAIERALLAGEAVRIILHARGPQSPEGSRLLAVAAQHDVEVRAVGARELRRLLHLPPSGEGSDGTGSRSVEPGARAAEQETEFLAMLGPDPNVDLAGLLARGGAVWLLAGTAYPGNAGFVIRSAEVSGAAGVVIDARFDRAARRDAQRAAMRADRHLPVLFDTATRVVEAIRDSGHRLIAVEDVGQRAPWEVDLRGPVVIVVGGEEHGVPREVIDCADEIVRIPMAGFMPSYNLQAAMAAVMGERLRQLGIEV